MTVRKDYNIFATQHIINMILVAVFDEGVLKSDPDSSQRMISNLLATMISGAKRTTGEPVIIAHDSIYRRIIAVS